MFVSGRALWTLTCPCWTPSGVGLPQLSQVCHQINVEIVKRSDVGRFVVLPKRWIVERTVAWLNRCPGLPRIGSA